MTTAAAELAVGVLCGLHEIDSGSDACRARPDYAINRADYVIQQCAKAGIVLPAACSTSLRVEHVSTAPHVRHRRADGAPGERTSGADPATTARCANASANRHSATADD
jgi:hypothetical protein